MPLSLPSLLVTVLPRPQALGPSIYPGCLCIYSLLLLASSFSFITIDTFYKVARSLSHTVSFVKSSVTKPEFTCPLICNIVILSCFTGFPVLLDSQFKWLSSSTGFSLNWFFPVLIFP